MNIINKKIRLNLFYLKNSKNFLSSQKSSISVILVFLLLVNIAFADLYLNSRTGNIYLNTSATARMQVTAGGNLALLGLANVSIPGNLSVGGNLSVDGSTFFVDGTSDRVGIGTTGPDEKLDVRGTIQVGVDGTTAGKIRLMDSLDFGTEAEIYSNNAADLVLEVAGSNSDVALQGSAVGTAGKISFQTSGDTELGYFKTGTTDVGDFSVDSGTLYVDASAGNVGIGTTSPSQKLVVVGTANITAGLNVTGGIRVSGLASCDTVDTDASGNFKCGTDDSTSGGSAWNWADNASKVLDNVTIIRKGNTSWFTNLYDSRTDRFDNENFTARYDARTDRYGKANYSAEYASTGWKLSNFTSAFGNRLAELWKLSNFTSAYDARADRYGKANYSAEYASTGWKLSNFTSAFGNRLAELWKLSNFTSAYDARTDRWQLANYSAEYASTGYKKANLTSDIKDVNTSAWNVTESEILPADSRLNVSVDSDTLFVDAENDRVGIGTTSPSSKLEVVGNVSVNGSIFITDTNGSLFQPIYGSDDDLVLYLPFNAPNGSTQYDRSPYGNDGTLKGGINCNVTHGKYGVGCSFNNDTQDYIEIADSASLRPTEVITVEVWLKTSTSQGSIGVVNKGSFPSGSDRDYLIWFSSTQVFFIMKDSGGTQDYADGYTFNYYDGVWHYYTATFDGDWIRFYIDGSEVASKDTALTNIRSSTKSLFLGAYNDGLNNHYFNGSIDEVKIYKRALTADEIRAHYLRGKGYGASGAITADKFRIVNTSASKIFEINQTGATIAPGGVQRLTIISGNVGIGTTMPNTKLEVNGTLTVGGDINIPAEKGDLNVGGGYSSGGISLIGQGGDKGTGQFGKDILLDGEIISVYDIEINQSFIPTKDKFMLLGNASKRFLDTYTINVKSGNETLVLNANVSIVGNLTVDTNVLFVDAKNDRVGIGTTSPTSILHINGADPKLTITDTGDTYPTFQIFQTTHDDVALVWDAYIDGATWKSSDAGSNFWIYKFSDGLNFMAESGIAQGSATSYSTAMTIQADADVVFPTGNVGIGTTSPDNELHIKGANPGLRIETDTNGGQGRIIFTNESNDPVWAIAYRDTDKYFYIGQDAEYGSTNSRLMIDNGGNVGIGTTTPEDLVDIYSAGADPTTTLQIRADRTAYGNVRADLKTYAGGSTSLDRFTINVGSSGDAFNVLGNGNVGIGTTVPGANINTGAYFKPDSSGTNVDIYSENNEAVLNLVSNQDASGAHIGGLYFTRAAGNIDAHKQIAAIQARQNNDVGTSGTYGGDLYFFTKKSGTGDGVDSPKMVILNTGNVGIGTTSPQYLLQTAKASGGKDVNLSGTLYVNGSSGNVGIGTTSPDTKLHLVGNITLEGEDPYIVHDYIGSGGFRSKIVFDRDVDDGNIRFYTTTNGAGDMTEQMVIHHDGNVGIGTTSPQSLLHVWTGNAGTDPAWIAGTDQFIIEDETNSIIQLFSPTLGALEFSDAARGQGIVGYLHATDDMYFSTNGSERVRIKSNGNVGIGVTSPGAKLDVAGSSILGSGTSSSLTLKGTYAGQFNNLVKNAGFASWSAGTTSLPDNWYLQTGTSPAYLQDTASGGKGSYSIKFTASGGSSNIPRIYQSISIRPSTTYTVGFDYKTEAGVNAYFEANDGTSDLGGGSAPASTTWTHLTRTFTTGASATNLQLRPGISNGGVVGSVWFSNVILVEGQLDPSFTEKFLSDSGNQTIMAGNVGIGTTSPTSLLYVGSSTYNADAILNVNAQNAGSNYQGINLITGATLASRFGISYDTRTTVGTKIGSVSASYPISLVVGDVAKMFIATDGNVGIGTTSPSEELHVNGSGDTVAIVQAGAGDKDSRVELHLDDGLKWLIGVDDSDNDEFRISTTATLSNAEFTINGSGNVGIGTTNPLVKLQVGTDNTGEPTTLGTLTPAALIMGAAQSTTEASVLRLVRPVTGGVSYPGVVDFKMKRYTSGTNHPYTQLTIGLKRGQSYDQDTDDIMTLLDNGKVGIGTTSPSQKLEVAGHINITDNIIYLSEVRSGRSDGDVYIHSNTNNDIYMGDLATNGFFYEGSSGNVGIGTTSPSAGLHVVGSIASEKKYDGSDDGLVLYFPFPENTGTVATDRSKSGLAGTLTNGATWGSGIFGYGSTLDGSDDYISVAAPASSISFGTSMTYSMWINVSSYSGKTRQYLFDPRGDGGVGGMSTYFLFDDMGSNTVRFTAGNSGLEVLSNTVAMSLSTWHHVAATRNGNTWVIYLDGVSIGSGTTDTTSLSLSNAFRIGTYSNAGAGAEYYFNGTIDEARMYNRTLSANEVRLQYLEGIGTYAPYTTTSGNVGIGTASPSNELEVNGDIELTNLYDNDASNFFDGTCTTAQGVQSISSTGAITCQTIAATDTDCAAGQILLGDGSCADNYDATDDTIGSIAEWDAACTDCVGNDDIAASAVDLTSQALSTAYAGDGLAGGGASALIFDCSDVTGTASDGIACSGEDLTVAGGTCLTADASGLGVTANCIDDAQVVDDGLDASSLAADSVSDSELDGGFGWTLDTDLNIDSNTLVVSQDDDRVGIGTASPGTKLEVLTGGGGSTPAIYGHDSSGTLTISGAYQRGYGVIGFSSVSSQSMASNYGANYETTGGAFFAVNKNGNSYAPVGIYSEANGTGGSTNAYAFRGYASGATNNYGVYVTSDKNYFSGNVGIGHTAPHSKLTIGGVDSGNSGIAIQSGTSGTTYHHDVTSAFSSAATGNYLAFDIASGSATQTEDVLFLRGDGNVGIGTTKPGALLHLENNNDNITLDHNGTDALLTFSDGDFVFRTTEGVEVPTAVSIKPHASATGAGDYPTFSIWDSNSENLILSTLANGGTISAPNNPLYLNHNTNQNVLMVTGTSNGNVGIGTTAPGQKLTVVGTANATDFVCAAGNCIGSADISGLDISSDTNLAVTAPITLTDDTIGITMLKDITASGTGMSGGANDVLPGADGDVTITLTTAKDLVVSGTGMSGGENDVFPGADADVSVTLTTSKDIVAGTGLSGGEDNVLPGADADTTINLEMLRDLVVSGTGMSGGGNDVLAGEDADVTVTLTTAKDIVAGNGLTGGEDNVLPGADADTTLAVGAGTCITANANDVAVTANCIDDAQVVDNGLDASSLAPDSVSDSELDGGFGWTLDTDLNIDSNTLVVSYDDDKVGIGTASPSTKLDVDGTFNASDAGGASIAIDGTGNIIFQLG